MKEDPTTFGANGDQLAKLWSIGSDVKNSRADLNEDQVRSELLHDMLAGKLPLEQAIAQTLPRVLGQLCEDIKPFTGNSLGVLLYSPETDLHVIKKIKDYAKGLSRNIKSDAEHDVIAMVYYAAIAGALVNHAQRITSFSYERLSHVFGSMLEPKWITPDLATLFQKAREYCIQKLNT